MEVWTRGGMGLWKRVAGVVIWRHGGIEAKSS